MTGRYERYVYPRYFIDYIQGHGKPESDPGKTIPLYKLWAHVFDAWDEHTSLDLQERFGIDTEDAAFMQRPLRWVRVRVFDLINDPDSRLGRWAAQEAR